MTEHNKAAAVAIEVPWVWMEGSWDNHVWQKKDGCYYDRLVESLNGIEGASIKHAAYRLDDNVGAKLDFDNLGKGPNAAIIYIQSQDGKPIADIRDEASEVVRDLLKKGEAEYGSSHYHFGKAAVVTSQNQVEWFQNPIRVSLLDESGYLREPAVIKKDGEVVEGFERSYTPNALQGFLQHLEQPA